MFKRSSGYLLAATSRHPLLFPLKNIVVHQAASTRLGACASDADMFHGIPSLPLDHARRFARHAANDAVNAAHLVDDACTGAGEEGVHERTGTREYNWHVLIYYIGVYVNKSGISSLSLLGILAKFSKMNAKTKVSAAEFQNNFGRYADAARHAPVIVTRYGRDELVVLSAVEYEQLRASFRRVLVLKEMTADGAAELLEALARAPQTPASVALDHLMSNADKNGE